jgi:hypothetical protein
MNNNYKCNPFMMRDMDLWQYIRSIFGNNARIQFIDTYFGQNGFINNLESQLCRCYKMTICI